MFYKIRYTGCIFKMCRNFTYEVVEQRRRRKAIKKKCSFYFFFFRVLHEASSSWLKFLHNLQNHPVFLNFSLVIAKELRIYGLIYETTK
jgi:hypothetical protein